MNSLEKIAYIKGMIAGLDHEFKGNDGRILKEMLELLETLSAEVTDLRQSLDYTDSELAAINEDLLRIEDRFYGGFPARGASPDAYQEDDFDSDEDDSEEDDGFEYFVVCPSCNEKLGITMEDLERGAVDCPACGENLEFEFDEDCDCGCGHDHDHHNHDHHGHSHE